MTEPATEPATEQVQIPEELSFRSNLDGTCVVIGLGTWTKPDLVIPSHSPQGDLVVDCLRIGCVPGLTSITFPSGIVGIGAGQEALFWDCNKLTSVTIPDSVTEIGNAPFYNCRNLTSITYTGTIEQWNMIKKSGWDSHMGNYTIHCVDGDISK